jgi:hypothetical protein
MMSPTALDLAILPFLLYALLRVLQGRMGWLGVAVPAVAFLLLSHPWTLAVLAVAGGVLGVLALAVPWSARRGPPITLAGVAASIALLGSAVGLSLSGCGGLCGPAFRDVVSGGDRLAVLGPWVVAASLAPLALLVAARRTRLASVAWPGHRRSWPARLAAAAILAAMVAATTVVAVRQGMPPMVNLPRMFGWPILAVGALGLLLAPLDPRPVSNAGAALCLATYPLVVFNPLHSPFWSHRTAVFLGLGLVILVGCAAGTVATAVRHRVARSRLASSAGPRLAGASSLLVLALATGGVAAATPAPYAWYRLYSPCEFDGLQDTARRADADPTALVVAGDWQAKLVVAGLADNASRIWFARSFFTSAHDRQSILTSMQGQGRPVYAIVDHHLRDGGAVDASFLDSAPWTPLGTWCAPGAASAPGVRLYVAGVPP